MSRSNKGCRRFARFGDAVLMKCYAFVGFEHRGALADDSISVSYVNRHVTDFIAIRFPAVNGSTKMLESLQKEGANIVRLQAPSFRTFHVVPNLLDPLRVQALMNERSVIDQFAKSFDIEMFINDLIQLRSHFGLFAVTNRANQ